MAEIINLRRARKAKAREAADATASANRRKFGETRAERERQAAEAALRARQLEGHRREEPDDA